MAVRHVVHSFILFVALLVPVRAEGQSSSHRLFLQVVDQTGMPVEGLTAADFAITETGTARTITRVKVAADPMRIVLLVDTSHNVQPSIGEIRSAVQTFVDGIAPQHEIALITIGNTPVVRQAPTTDHAKLKDLAKKLTTGGSTILFSGLLEMYDRFLRNATDRWPLMVIVTSDGEEGSSGVDTAKFTAAAQDMQPKDVIVHAVVLSVMGQGLEVQISRALTQVTAGHYDSISAASALPAKMDELAKIISAAYDRTRAQYVLEYATDTKDANAELHVSVPSKQGVAVTVSRQGRIR
jgi:Mg-chelatase subunit ChlD